MSASFFRDRPASVIPFPTAPSPEAIELAWDCIREAYRDSIDALDCSEVMLLAAGDIGASGRTLFDYPTNANAIDDAEAAAIRVLAAVSQMRKMGGVS